MARAISSLPVPRSPVMSTRPVDGAALAMVSKMRFMRGELPTR